MSWGSQCWKCVDDILVAAPSPEALKKTCNEILKRLEEKNIKVSREKIFLGKEVEYCGYIISGEGVSPNPDRITALKTLSPPANVREVRSLLGALQQLNHYLPDLADVLKPINSLLRKDTQFIWEEEQKEAWEKIHTMLETKDMSF